MLNYLSLFSGIGAPEKALANLGVPFHLVNYCEIDKYASRSYAAVHGVSEDLNLWDVTKVTENDIKERVDFITHGSPCQDFSIAGKQAGADEGSGTRSSLMYETLRIVEKMKPKFIIWENVKNVLSPKHIHNFENYKNRLSELGYNSYYQVLNAKNYGIPQNRERIFCISIRTDIDKGFEFPEPFELKLRLKDILEDKVDEKYYLSESALNGLIERKQRNEDGGVGFGFVPKSENEIANNLETKRGRSTDTYLVDNDGRYKVREATKKGYALACPGDSINLEQPNSKNKKRKSWTWCCSDIDYIM